MGYRKPCDETIKAAKAAMRPFPPGKLRTAISDAVNGKSMSLQRENWLRAWLSLPPLRVVHVETAAPKDERRDVRGRFPAELAEEAKAIYGTLTAALQWAVDHPRCNARVLRARVSEGFGVDWEEIGEREDDDD